MNKERKTPWTGIAVGLVAALVAPLLALAHHDSGEQSGDDPLQLAAGATGGSSARASFRVDDGQEVTSYHLDVASDGPGSSTGWQVAEDGALLPADCRSDCLQPEHFTVERCGPWTGCIAESWPIYAYSNLYFPTASIGAKQVSAIVQTPDGGRCDVEVIFDDFGTPRVMSSSDETTGSHGGSARARVRIGRSAVAEMTMTCRDSSVEDVSLTSVDAAIYTDVAGSARAVADAENPPQP